MGSKKPCKTLIKGYNQRYYQKNRRRLKLAAGRYYWLHRKRVLRRNKRYMKVNAKARRRAGKQSAAWQARHPIRQARLSKRSTLSARRKRRDYVDKIKASTPCADCRRYFPAICLDFDHRPEFKKRAGISELVQSSGDFKRIDAEIKKCDIVCACCHRLRTQQRRHS